MRMMYRNSSFTDSTYGIISPKPKHKCSTPWSIWYRNGTLFRCETCGQVWLLGNPFEDLVSSWHRVPLTCWSSAGGVE